MTKWLDDRRFVYVLLLLGAVLAVLSLVWDELGIGETEGFGVAQIVGIVVGVAAMLFAVYLRYVRKPPAA